MALTASLTALSPIKFNTVCSHINSRHMNNMNTVLLLLLLLAAIVPQALLHTPPAGGPMFGLVQSGLVACHTSPPCNDFHHTFSPLLGKLHDTYVVFFPCLRVERQQAAGQKVVQGSAKLKNQLRQVLPCSQQTPPCYAHIRGQGMEI
jgi:hypothetical protein